MRWFRHNTPFRGTPHDTDDQALAPPRSAANIYQLDLERDRCTYHDTVWELAFVAPSVQRELSEAPAR